jgi:hypothetical protein
VEKGPSTGTNRWPSTITSSQHLYEIRPRKDHRGVDLISDALPFGRLWYGEPNAVSNAVGYSKFFSRLHDTVIRVYDCLISDFCLPGRLLAEAFGVLQVGVFALGRIAVFSAPRDHGARGTLVDLVSG